MSSDKGEDTLVAVNPMYDEENESLPEDVEFGGVDVNEMNKDNRWWDVLSGQRKKRTEMDAFIKHYLFGDESAQNRFIDKLVFVLSVVACVFLTYCVASPQGRAFLPYYLVASAPTLMVIRYFQYKKTKAHYFLLDFCYWANTGCVIYVLAFPGNALWFAVLFAVTHAPLPWTVIAYRNSLVFHSIDKFTSCYIHVFPMAVFYAIRWHAEDCSRLWYATFNVDAEGALADMFNLAEPSKFGLALFMTLMVALVFVVQQALEIFFINVVAKHPCAKNIFHVYYDDEYQTLFRYSSNKGHGIIYKLINAFGPKFRLTMWVVINLIYTMFTAVPVWFWFEYQIANVVFANVVFVWAVWNGANFYIESFARGRYKFRRASKIGT